MSDIQGWDSKAKNIMNRWEEKEETPSAGVRPATKALVDCFSTHFLEHEFKREDLLVHVFPRGGAEDRYYPPSYGVPGRLEEPVEGISFPDDMCDRIANAASVVWAGDVSADYVPELKSYAIQFLGAASVLKDPECLDKFVDQFSEALDASLGG